MARLGTHRDPIVRCTWILSVALLGVSCILASGYVVFVGTTHDLGHDFAGTVWNPGRAVLEGSSPYPDESYYGSASVNPAPTILAFVPLSLLSLGTASTVMSLLLLAAAAGALVVLGIRDWFVYVAVLTSFTVLGASSWGNTTAFTVLLVALAWRDRQRSWLWLAVAVLVKLWLLPALLWLVFTRPRQATLSILALVGALALGWAVIGGDGLSSYPARLNGVQDAHAQNGVLVHALVLNLTHSSALAAAGSLGLAALLVAVARNVDERRMFQVILAACLVASPIVWPWYLALLIVVIGVSERRDARALWMAFTASWLFVLSPAGLPLPYWLLVVSLALVAIAISAASEVSLKLRRGSLQVPTP